MKKHRTSLFGQTSLGLQQNASHFINDPLRLPHSDRSRPARTKESPQFAQGHLFAWSLPHSSQTSPIRAAVCGLQRREPKLDWEWRGNMHALADDLQVLPGLSGRRKTEETHAACTEEGSGAELHSSKGSGSGSGKRLLRRRCADSGRESYGGVAGGRCILAYNACKHQIADEKPAGRGKVWGVESVKRKKLWPRARPVLGEAFVCFLIRLGDLYFLLFFTFSSMNLTLPIIETLKLFCSFFDWVSFIVCWLLLFFGVQGFAVSFFWLQV